MATFDDLMKKEHVANHPLLKGVYQRSKAAQALDNLDLNDLFSQSVHPHKQNKEKDMDVRGMIFAASRAIEDAMAQFLLPIPPRVAYNNTRDVKYARNDQSRIVEGLVLFNVEFVSESGVKKHATIHVHVKNGIATPPSTIDFDDRRYVLSQDTMDEVLRRATTYELLELRQEFDAPLSKQERELAVELRNTIGWRPRNLTDGYMMTPTKAKAGATGMHAVPRGFKAVVAAMKAAEAAGEDTFPRSWVYVLHNYILPHVNTASKDSWEPHLINAGFCYNPFGQNRGRPVNAQVMDGNAIDIPDPGLYIVDADEKIEGNVKIYDFYFSDGTNVQFDPDSGNSLFAEGGGKSQQMPIGQVPQEYTSIMQKTIQADKAASEGKFKIDFKGDTGIYNSWDEAYASFKKNYMDVAEDKAVNSEESTFKVLNQLAEQHILPVEDNSKEDKTAQDLGIDLDMFDEEDSGMDKEIDMEVSDEPTEMAELLQKMYPGTRTPMERNDQVKFHGGRGKIVDIDAENDYIIISNKGIEYRVKVDEIEPLPSTFKKMYM